jgi:geranylgeranyl transferase type-1 subunit beta
MLDDWSGIDQPLAVNFIQQCRSWDGAFALIPGQEGHGGSTFCAVASLALMGKLDDVLDGYDDVIGGGRKEMIQWCVSRQIEGMQGRPNKLEDTCYSYWIGGTLKILNCDHLLDKRALKSFIMDCQTDMGGFNKLRNGLQCPDLLHSFYSLAWLSLEDDTVVDDGNEGGEEILDVVDTYLHPVDCILGVSYRRMKDFLLRK